jgi:dTDP-4-amino-4,6-dideoxygalactose transaminase
LLDRINDLLDRRGLTNHGPYVQECERRIACAVGVHNCIAVCNATVGLQIAIKAAGLSSLESCDEFVEITYRNYRQYKVALQGIPGVTLCECDERERNHYQYIVLDVDGAESRITRDLLSATS